MVTAPVDAGDGVRIVDGRTHQLRERVTDACFNEDPGTRRLQRRQGGRETHRLGQVCCQRVGQPVLVGVVTAQDW